MNNDKRLAPHLNGPAHPAHPARRSLRGAPAVQAAPDAPRTQWPRASSRAGWSQKPRRGCTRPTGWRGLDPRRPGRGQCERLGPGPAILAKPGWPKPGEPPKGRELSPKPRRPPENYHSQHASGPAPTTLPRGLRGARGDLRKRNRLRQRELSRATVRAGAAGRGSPQAAHEAGGLPLLAVLPTARALVRQAECFEKQNPKLDSFRRIPVLSLPPLVVIIFLLIQNNLHNIHVSVTCIDCVMIKSQYWVSITLSVYHFYALVSFQALSSIYFEISII